MTIKNETNKVKVLKENFENSNYDHIRDFVVSQSENDPNFFRWLFSPSPEDGEYFNDFECPEAWEDFVNENFGDDFKHI